MMIMPTIASRMRANAVQRRLEPKAKVMLFMVLFIRLFIILDRFYEVGSFIVVIRYDENFSASWDRCFL